jgi:hypothetical protein
MSPWLLPVVVRDALIRQLVETSHFYNEATGELYDPPVLPPDPDGVTGTATSARTTSRDEVAAEADAYLAVRVGDAHQLPGGGGIGEA